MTRLDRPGVSTSTYRTTAEREAAAAAARLPSTTADPVAVFKGELPSARMSVLQRTIAALLKEAPAGLPTPTVRTVGELPDVLPADADIGAVEHALDLGAWRRTDDPDLVVAAVPLSESAVVVAPVEERHAFDRYIVDSPVILVEGSALQRLTHPTDFATRLINTGVFVDDAAASRYRAEVENSAASIALSRTAGRLMRTAPLSRPHPAVTKAPMGADYLAGLERYAAIEERASHPAGKIHGLTHAAAVEAFPEFTEVISLRFVAVPPECATEYRSEGAPSITDTLYDTFPWLAGAVAEAVSSSPATPEDADPADYSVIPVHPWQFENLLPERYADELADGRIVPVEFSAPATPLLSQRTVVPFSRPGAGPAPHIKLPLAVTKFDHERAYPPEETHNGPLMADLLADIDDTDPFTGLGILVDSAAIHYEPGGGPHIDGPGRAAAEHLSACIRTNPLAHPRVEDGDVAVVGAALTTVPPMVERPLLTSFVDIYRTTHGHRTEREAALAFLSEYVDVVLPDHLRLLSKYGISLESHLQNTVMVFDESAAPKAALFRDFGGIRVSESRLERAGYTVDIYPDSDINPPESWELYRKVYSSFVQNHVAEIVAALAHHTTVDEAACWDLVREKARAIFADLRADPDVPTEQVDIDEETLFADNLLSVRRYEMLFAGETEKEVRLCSTNPFAGFPPEDK